MYKILNNATLFSLKTAPSTMVSTKNLYVMSMLKLARYRFIVRWTTAAVFDQPAGAVLYGAFKTNFYHKVCLRKHEEKCTPCPLFDYCPHAYLFTAPVPKAIILEPPLEKRNRWTAGESFVFDLILIGDRANSFIPELVATMLQCRHMGLGSSREDNQGRFNLEQVVALHPRQPMVVFDGRRCIETAPPSMPGADLWDRSVQTASRDVLKLTFQTPVCLERGKKMMPRFTFWDLVTALNRRLHLLLQYHAGFDRPLMHLDRQAAETVTSTDRDMTMIERIRNSGRQRQSISLNGLVGTMTFRGPFQSFLPLLTLGTWLHVGSDTAYGQGRYTFTLT
jgi:hypothetical protein